MNNTIDYYDFVPRLVPKNMIGTITRKIWLKKDHVKKDGTCSLYLELYQKVHSKIFRKRINLKIAVPINLFDIKKQRIKSKHEFSNDYNLLIEKKLADINTIEVNYRLNNQPLTINMLVNDLTNPELRINFYSFWSDVMEYQREKEIISYATYKQQRATLNKLKQFRPMILFKDINEELLMEIRSWLKHKKKQAPATIEIVFKNFKKYLHAANKKGIKTPIDHSFIKIKKVKSNYTFLLPGEVKKLYRLYNNKSISYEWKKILQRYLFSCFTGLRISDILTLTEENIIDGNLVFISQKSKKLQRICLNKTAKSLIHLPHIFDGSYTEQVGNRELKLIAHACGIKKRLYFHSARHTFATNYLISGGKIRNLQKILGHSNIETTMIYAHVVDSLMDKEIGLLDDILN